mmetsp:Transcript_63632/g.149431  ORF Transcript_63632/g.149431 Transcript_63632/m.149431 type:complete len:243 (+) Transcript_63632:1814-2542(+)
MADEGIDFIGRVQQSVSVVAHKLRVRVVSVPRPTNVFPNGCQGWIRSIHGSHREPRARYVERHLFHQRSHLAGCELIEQEPRPLVIQVVYGVAINVLHHILGHHVLEGVPLVAKVMASTDGHVVRGHLCGFLLEMIQPAILDWHRVHFHQEERGVFVFKSTCEHCLHDALEDRVGALHPVLVDCIALAVILILLWTELRRHVSDACEAAGPTVLAIGEASLQFRDCCFGFLVVINVLAVDQH